VAAGPPLGAHRGLGERCEARRGAGRGTRRRIPRGRVRRWRCGGGRSWTAHSSVGRRAKSHFVRQECGGTEGSRAVPTRRSEAAGAGGTTSRREYCSCVTSFHPGRPKHDPMAHKIRSTWSSWLAARCITLIYSNVRHVERRQSQYHLHR
jgi:hypothetical protein